MDDGRRLAELFVALFRTERELRRFVRTELPEGTGSGRKSFAAESVAKSAPEIAATLVDDGAVTADLFEALTRWFPDRAADVAGVRDHYLAAGPTAVPEEFGNVRNLGYGDGSRAGDVTINLGTVPAKYAAAVAALRADLDTLELPPDDGELATTSADHWAWTAPAAVLGSFRPSELRPLPGTSPEMPALVALADLVLVGHHGLWTLRDDVRAPVLRQLWAQERMAAALGANEHVEDARRDWLGRLLRQGLPGLSHLDPRDLDDLDVVLGWLQPFDGQFAEDRVAVQAAVERRILIDPLRALVGRHFRGRARELATVTGYLAPAEELVPASRPGAGDAEPVLVVTGPGGSGKSTLLGKLLLDLEDEADDRLDRRPFAYIDFDKARHDPRSPRGLLEQIVRQLQLLYATSTEASAAFYATEGLYSEAGPPSFEAEALGHWAVAARDRPLDAMVELLATTLDSIDRLPDQSGLVLVFDTFEEVVRKGPGALGDVWSLIDALRAAIPGIRVVVAGRGVVDRRPEGPGRFGTRVRLGDLDPEAADAVLAHLGVGDPRLRHLIVDQYGGNPLTLHLAADVVARTGSADEAFHGIERQADVLAEVAQEQVQGMLYSRILGHLKDDDVVKVAHPGLVVRRVTVPVLRDVLAVPCGFDPAEADDLFERLRAEVTMFELEDGDTLRHRQDVRRLMLRAIYDDPRRTAQVAEIHRRAIEHYATAKDPQGRAELLYHRLMSGEDPRELDRLWSRDLADLLDSALEEPLPAAARTWLARRADHDPEVDTAHWEQADWEAAVESEAASWMLSLNPAKALELLGRRSVRLPGSSLYTLEVAARLALDDVAGAAEVLGRGMTSAIEAGDQAAQLDLAEQAVDVHARLHNTSGVVESGEAAESLADLLGEPARGLVALSRAVTELRGLGELAAATTVCAGLTDRFTDWTRDALRERPNLVRTVLRAAGPLDATVLRHAAAEVGDETDEATGVFARDPFTVARLLDGVTPAGHEALAGLADEVGLGTGWTTIDLASQAVRAGRTGQAVTLGLDHAADPAAARDLVVDGLVRPADTATWPGRRPS